MLSIETNSLFTFSLQGELTTLVFKFDPLVVYAYLPVQCHKK